MILHPARSKTPVKLQTVRYSLIKAMEKDGAILKLGLMSASLVPFT